jgi:3D (Asp-Asp-Asp) domain-containing protein
MKQKGYFLITVGYFISVISVFGWIMNLVINEKLYDSKTIITKKYVYNSVPYSDINYNVLDSFTGYMTGYGPDCKGCTGLVYCKPYPDVRNGNIYYDDKDYGTIRIVAADKAFPCGTIVRITVSKLYKDPLIAIVLDRGGLIKGKKFDLLFKDEEATKPVGFQRNVKYEVLRYGW